MTLVTKTASVSVCNRSPRVLHLRLEPEGDYISVGPGSTCVVTATSPAVVDVELVHEGNDVVALWIDDFKTVSVDGVRVRE